MRRRPSQIEIFEKKSYTLFCLKFKYKTKHIFNFRGFFQTILKPFFDEVRTKAASPGLSERSTPPTLV